MTDPVDKVSALRDRDLAHLWHPCTQMKDHERDLPLIPIRSGRGVWLTGYDDRQYLDAISSWWVNLFGHANPRISAAVAAQLDQLEHVIFAGFTHEPAIDLAESLTRLAPPGSDALLPCRQWLRCGGSGREDELSLLAQLRTRRQAEVHHAGQQLPRRDAGRAGRRQCRALQGYLRAIADGRDHRALAGLLLTASPARAGRTIPAASSSPCASCWSATRTRPRQ